MSQPTPLLATAYMPSVAYMAILATAEHATIEHHETYPKQTHRNRCTILTAAGAMDLVVPVSRPDGNHTLTRHIVVSYSEPWNVRHWRAIESAYSASPYFLYYADTLHQLLTLHHQHLFDLNAALLSYLMRSMKITTTLQPSADFIPPSTVATSTCRDLRYTLTPKQQLPSGCFPPYSQVFNDRLPFIPNLSAIDLLFNLGPESKNYLLQVARHLSALNGTPFATNL